MEIIKFDFSALSGYYNARINQRLASSLSTAATSQTAQSADQASASSDLPWRDDVDAKDTLRKALGAATFLPKSVADNARKENGDVAKIFAAYEALAMAKSIADAAKEGELPAGQEARAQKRMLEGIAEVRSFLGSVDIKKSILLSGERLSKAESEVAIQRSTSEYNTKTLHDGDYDAEVSAFTGNRVFTISASKSNTTTDISIDLAEMGTTVRNLDNVADFINGKLEAAGMLSRFERVKIGEKNEDGVVEGNEFGFKIKGTSVEKLSFSAADGAPAAIMVGTSGTSGDSAGQLSTWTGLDSAEATRGATTRIGEDGKNTKFTATAMHPDGGYVAIGTTDGVVGSAGVRGEADAFMTRYDSQGKVLWTRNLGAASNAEGLGLAVSDTGQIAMTGVTTDKLTTTAVGGKKDGFVTMYDKDGIEQWTRQRGSAFDDQTNTVAFASDGSIVVAGTTSATLTNNSLTGGSDSFIEKIDVDGNSVWLRQFGTTGDDKVTSLEIADDGGIILAGVENGEAVVRRFESDVDSANDWTLNLGDLQKGTIADLKIASDGSIFIGGSTKASVADAGGFSGTEQADRDGFVARIDMSGAAPALDWVQRVGGAGYQSVNGITLSGDQVIVAGTGEGTFGNATSDKEQSAFITTLSQTDGAQGWTKDLSGRGGIATASDVIINPNYSDTLDVFGLPSGSMVISDSAAVTDRLPLRAGDFFYVSVNGGRDKKITIEQDDNLRSLSFKLNAALILDGNADVRRGKDGQRLSITPKEGVQIQLKPGSEGRDALGALGLSTGILMQKPVPGSDKQNDAPEIVAMGLRDDLNFDTEENINKAVDILDGALRALRTAYRWAVDDPTLLQLKNGDQGPGKKGGQVPAYMNAQLANLQAGLQRLTGGSSINYFA